MPALKTILPKIIAAVLFLAVVAAMILYNEGYYDFTFIKRDPGIVTIGSDSSTPETTDQISESESISDTTEIGDLSDEPESASDTAEESSAEE